MKPLAPDDEGGAARAPGGDRVAIYDTTLRDGTQREGISLSCEDKLRIARRLDDLGVAFIEGGWPGSNPKDAQFFERARDVTWKTAAITAFGSTRRAALAPEDDAAVRAMLDAATSVCAIFGKSSTLHVREVLRTSLDENLQMIEQTVAFLRAHGRRVVYDAEHFFDGYALDAGYALETLRAAARGGAEVLVLCDTNGGSMPWQVEAVVTAVRGGLGLSLPVPIGVHTHNDGECAVANAIAAVRAGARHVQGTINGYGERCGNANLCAVIPNLELKLGLRGLPDGSLARLTEASHFVAEVANLAPDEHMAYVGRSAFAHKGGVHVAAMRREPTSYQHIDPALVGNEMRVVVSELSGRGNMRSKAEEFGLIIEGGDETLVLEDIKEREARGASFEAAEASVALLLRRRSPSYKAPFRLLDYKVLAGYRDGSGTFVEAIIKVAVGDEVLLTAAEGCGPVNALDAALRKALAPAFPALREIHLVDYKVRILDGLDGTSATTRVLIDSRDAHRTWSTVGASENIIEASWHALADSIEYGLAFAASPKAERPAARRPESEVT
jgi:2-isopropylmalate synthase